MALAWVPAIIPAPIIPNFMAAACDFRAGGRKTKR
jgi:hypothetical protein